MVSYDLVDIWPLRQIVDACNAAKGFRRFHTSFKLLIFFTHRPCNIKHPKVEIVAIYGSQNLYYGKLYFIYEKRAFGDTRQV